tara:strand:- start:163360 stop:163557 length:198 start_codon:yes stop_codon:yes gene_type:complete
MLKFDTVGFVLLHSVEELDDRLLQIRLIAFHGKNVIGSGFTQHAGDLLLTTRVPVWRGASMVTMQ